MKTTYTKLSFILSLTGIILTVIINYKISLAYNEASGKTRALFGMIGILRFGYQYYVALLGILSILLTGIAFYKKEPKKPVIIALLAGLIATTLVFSNIWRIMIK